MGCGWEPSWGSWAGKLGKDGQAVCVGMLGRPGGEDATGLGCCRLLHPRAEKRMGWGRGPAPPQQTEDPLASWALSLSVALVLGVTRELAMSPLSSAGFQEPEGPHPSQWENTQGSHLEPGERAQAWPPLFPFVPPPVGLRGWAVFSGGPGPGQVWSRGLPHGPTPPGSGRLGEVICTAGQKQIRIWGTREGLEGKTRG